MGRFCIYANRDSGTIGGAVPSKPIADDFIGQLMGNDVIKPQPNPLKLRGTGINTHGIVIVQRVVILDADLNNRVHVAAFFDFSIGIGGITHEGRPSQLEVAQHIGMVYNL